MLPEVPTDTLAGCGLCDSFSELEDLLVGLDGLEDFWSRYDGLEHLSNEPEVLFRELGELEYLVERGDLLTKLGDSLMDVGDFHLAEGFKQFSSSVASSNLLEAIWRDLLGRRFSTLPRKMVKVKQQCKTQIVATFLAVYLERKSSRFLLAISSLSQLGWIGLFGSLES